MGLGLIIAIVFLLVFKGVVRLGSAGQTHVIMLTEDGFSPQEITITTGDMISFKTNRSVLFWPASNLHPTHDIYPEFDPKEPILPDKEWRFRFDKAGRWQFHDHLAPKYTGTVVVRDSNLASFAGDSRDARSADDCAKLSDGEQKQCWQDVIIATLQEKGLNAAFDLMASLHEAQPTFRGACHDITHKLGTAAYVQFAAGNDFKMSEKSAFCSFGFYHGFMETLVRSGKDLNTARAFCAYVDKQLSQDAPHAVFSCYHGIGHGLTDLHNKSEWGDERAMTKPALALCKKISENKEQLLLCGTGVFDAISLAYYNRAYGMVMKKDDPLWLCREQPDEFKESCYRDTMPAILWLGKSTLAGAAPYVEKFAPDPYAVIAIQSLATNSVRFTIQGNIMKPDVSSCRKLGRLLHIPCIKGLAQGVMEFGTPGVEYKEALDFCASSAVLSEEREPCIKSVLSYSSTRYSQKKFAKICTTVGEAYKHFCSS